MSSEHTDFHVSWEYTTAVGGTDFEEHNVSAADENDAIERALARATNPPETRDDVEVRLS